MFSSPKASVTNFALLLAPVTMVYLIGSLQPAIVLFLTILSTKFFPHIIKENLSKRVLIPKILAILLMIIGSAVLFLWYNIFMAEIAEADIEKPKKFFTLFTVVNIAVFLIVVISNIYPQKLLYEFCTKNSLKPVFKN